jgi:L-ascorbate metabolism protein UlaG (beta-lactamase superfamily)
MTPLERAKKIGPKFQAPIESHVGGLSLMLKALPELIRGRHARVPATPPGPFRTDPAAYATPSPSGLRVTWFGHSSSLIELDGFRLLLDPVWDDRAAPVDWAGPKRFFPPTLPIESLPALDAVLISHDHYDHLGKRTVQRLAAQRPELRWIAPLGVAAELANFGVALNRITELDWTESTVIGQSLTITALPARHFSGRSAFNRNHTLWASFAIRGPRHNVYYGADSGPWDGFATIGRDFGPFDLTLLEIGASDPLWPDIHLGPDCAAAAFHALGGGLLMPIHWGLFDLALHPWRQPIERLLELSAAQSIPLFAPEPGLPTEVTPGIVSNWWR